MKYFCCVNIKKSDTGKDAIILMYPRAKVIDGLDNLFESIQPFDTVIFDNILELDEQNSDNYTRIEQTYKQLHDLHIDVMFDRSPNCDEMIIENYIQQFHDLNPDMSDDKLFEMILRMQIEAYINIKDATANAKRYSQLSASKFNGKSFGRPKGTKRESDKAKKAKKIILSKSKEFGGDLTDEECIPLSGASRNMYYRYKKQLKAMRGENNDGVQ